MAQGLELIHHAYFGRRNFSLNNATWVYERHRMLRLSHHSHLVEETNDLASNVLSPGLLVVHDTGRGGKDNVTELTRWKELDNPLLEVTELNVVARADDTGLVEAGNMLDIGSLCKYNCNTYRPLSWMTILPLRWSSTSSNSPM